MDRDRAGAQVVETLVKRDQAAIASPAYFTQPLRAQAPDTEADKRVRNQSPLGEAY
jgi:hypothetical protein